MNLIRLLALGLALLIQPAAAQVSASDLEGLWVVERSTAPTLRGELSIVRDGDAQWENFERCEQCYAQPLADLENQLLLYERLRVIYRSTKDYVNNAITLGDKIPKPHALLENAWAAQKFSINQSFEKTKQVFKDKYYQQCMDKPAT